MNPLRFQNVRGVLAELEGTEDFKALWNNPDDRAQRFRQGVELVGMRCLTIEPDPPTDREIHDRLVGLEGLCVGPLAGYRRFILMARDALTS